MTDLDTTTLDALVEQESEHAADVEDAAGADARPAQQLRGAAALLDLEQIVRRAFSDPHVGDAAAEIRADLPLGRAPRAEGVGRAFGGVLGNRPALGLV